MFLGNCSSRAGSREKTGSLSRSSPINAPTAGEWWANLLAAFAGDRPAKPLRLGLSSWSRGGVTIAWRRGPAFLPAPPADRWEVRIARGGWTPAAVTDVPGGVLSTWLDGPPPEDGTRVSVRGVNAAGAGPASSIRIAMPRPPAGDLRTLTEITLPCANRAKP